MERREERRKQPAAAPQSLARRILLWAIFLTILAAPLVTLELFFAWRFGRDYPDSTIEIQGAWRFIPSPYRIYQNNPGFVRRLDGVSYHYNNNGFRNDEDLGPKEDGEFRIFILGGSTAYGDRSLERGQWQLLSGQKTYSTSETIGSHLQRILAARMLGHKVKVFTAATVAYRLHQSFLTYMTLLRYLEPDLVISIDGANEDYTSENPYGSNFPITLIEGGGAFVRLLRQHSYTMLYCGEYFRHSSLFYRLTGRHVAEYPLETLDAMDSREVRRKILSERDAYRMPKDVWEGLESLYDSFAHAAARDEVPLLFCDQPGIHIDDVKELTLAEQRILKYWYLKTEPRTYGMYALAGLLSKRTRSDPQFRFLSLLDVFEGFAGMAYADAVHLTPAANKQVAERLARRILADPALGPDLRPGPQDECGAF